jgi:hypothetical protein
LAATTVDWKAVEMDSRMAAEMGYHLVVSMDEQMVGSMVDLSAPWKAEWWDFQMAGHLAGKWDCS